MSGLENFERRNAIRQSWMRYITGDSLITKRLCRSLHIDSLSDPKEVIVLFVLADMVYARDNNTLQALLEEDKKYKDVMSLPGLKSDVWRQTQSNLLNSIIKGVREEYKALGERLLHMLFEVTEQYDYQLLMKVEMLLFWFV